MNIESPKDADGREIPLDTKVLYDRYGFKNLVKSFMYVIRTDTCTGIWRVKFTTGTSLFAVSDIGKKCAECKLYAGDCTVNMCKDIASRINELRSESK